MNRIFSFLIIVCAFSACKKPIKDSPIVTDPTEVNTLISGGGTGSFQRIIQLSGNTVLKSVKQTADGGYIICGTSKNNNNEVAFLYRADATGKLLWYKIFASVNDEEGQFIEIAKDSNFLLTTILKYPNGGAHAPPQSIPALTKTDRNGNLLWQKIFKQVWLGMVKQVWNTGNGNYIVAINNIDNSFIYMKTFDALGTELKSDTLVRIHYLIDFKETQDGGFLVLAQGYSSSNIYRLNNHLDTLWTKFIPDSLSIDPTSISEDLNGNILFSVKQRVNNSLTDLLQILDPKGRLLSSTSGQYWLGCINPTSDGSYIANAYDESSSSKVSLVKIDNNGVTIWQSFFSYGKLNLQETIQTTDKGYISVGSSVESGKNYGYILKTDKNGN
jgi:hypothetical protein